MRSQLYYLCLLVVYSTFAASASMPAIPARHMQRARAARPFGASAPEVARRAQSTLALDPRIWVASPTFKTVSRVLIQEATKTRTKTVTRVTGTSTQTLVYTQTLTRTATTTAQPQSTPALVASSTSSSKVSSTRTTSSSTVATSSAPPSKTTYTTVKTPVPTSKNAVFKGVGTYYYTGLNACGQWDADTDYIVAVQDKVFDNYPGATLDNSNLNPICNKRINITWGGKTVQAAIVDRCAGCETNHIDMSPTVFSQLADLDVGYLQKDFYWSWA